MAADELLDVLSEFARTMATDFPIQGSLDHLVKRIVEVLPITAAGVTVITPGRRPRYVAASNAAALRFEKLQTELGEGPCVAAYQTGEAISAPDLSTEERFPTFSRRAFEAGLAAVFTFPLNHGEQRLGALDLYRDTPGPLSSAPIVAAQTLADIAAAYLLNAQSRADLQDSFERAREAALHDSLTGLPNRVLILERLEHAFLRGRRTGSASALFFVDLDRFEAVNDAHGRRVGDELLVAVAGRLSGVLRPGDTLARVSGDEFAILCEDLDNPSEADAIVAHIGAVLTEPFVVSAGEVALTASVGIALTNRGDDDSEQLLHTADLAMYRAKSRSAGRLHAPDRNEPRLGERRGRLEHALPGAAERGELHLAYQPIVAASDGRLTGVEALLRWTYPGSGLVSPAVLIPLAERSGQIVEIGQWVLERAWSDRYRWQHEQADDIAVSVNVSAHQLMSPHFADTVATVLDSNPTDPGLLTLEITESVFVRGGERVLFMLNDLKDMGVKLALDDFGTGYSSLGYLMRFPVDTVKIDRTFVANLKSDRASHTIVSAVIQLSHGLSMTATAEGVEAADQHHELARLGCDACQGFYFARPIPADRIDTLLRDHGSGRAPQLPAD
jgi:diguanylate cyclase (GGDEF)-like protein